MTVKPSRRCLPLILQILGGCSLAQTAVDPPGQTMEAVMQAEKQEGPKVDPADPKEGPSWSFSAAVVCAPTVCGMSEFLNNKLEKPSESEDLCRTARLPSLKILYRTRNLHDQLTALQRGNSAIRK
jgi:hypothetical protein